MTPPSAGDQLGLLEPQPDALIEVQPAGPDRRAVRSWRHSLGWSATSAPVALLLVTGIALGPRGTNLVSESALSLLSPVVPVALAALGVLVGLGLGDRRADERRALTAGSLDALVTMLVVSAGVAGLALTAMAPVEWPFWTVVLTAGICAATSLTLPTGNPLEPRSAVTRIVELGVLLPIVSGGILAAALREESTLGAIAMVAQASGLTLMLAAAGWLLLTQASSETEERVFAVSALLLVGGVADALSMSALFGGLVAGVFWRYMGRHSRDTINRDVLFVQHPLVVLVLLGAGARAEFSLAALALGVSYLGLRLAGKLAGGAVARRVVGGKVPLDLGLRLLSPGVFGVAFALNVVGIVGDEASVLLAAVVLATIGSECIALVMAPRKAAE